MKNKPTIQWGAIEPPLSEQNYFITEWKFTLKLGSCRDLVLWHTAHRSIEDFCLLCRGFSWGAVKGTKKKSALKNMSQRVKQCDDNKQHRSRKTHNALWTAQKPSPWEIQGKVLFLFSKAHEIFIIQSWLIRAIKIFKVS